MNEKGIQQTDTIVALLVSLLKSRENKKKEWETSCLNKLNTSESWKEGNMSEILLVDPRGNREILWDEEDSNDQMEFWGSSQSSHCSMEWF